MAQVTIGELTIDLQRKGIKNLHINVLPPDGRVRVSAPASLSDIAIRVAVVRRLAWIRQQQAAFVAQPRQSERKMCSGETHYLWGRGYRLDVIPTEGTHSVKLQGGWIRMRVPAHYDAARREALLLDWYRQLLRQRLPVLITKWQEMLKVAPSFVGIKRMKTMWGSLHLLERKHNQRFISLMDLHLPNWREHREKLNKMPLAFNRWGY